jgi:hypothetical protein
VLVLYEDPRAIFGDNSFKTKWSCLCAVCGSVCHMHFCSDRGVGYLNWVRAIPVIASTSGPYE